MADRVSLNMLVRSLTATGTGVLEPDAAGGPGAATNPACIVAQDLYYREARSLSVWSVLTWTLGAGTVVFALLILVLLSSALFETGATVDKIVKIAGTFGSAGATFVAGKGTLFVFARLKEQRTAVNEALTTVKGNCDETVAQSTEAAANAAAHKGP